jgi:hypothetical protein
MCRIFGVSSHRLGCLLFAGLTQLGLGIGRLYRILVACTQRTRVESCISLPYSRLKVNKFWEHKKNLNYFLNEY